MLQQSYLLSLIIRSVTIIPIPTLTPTPTTIVEEKRAAPPKPPLIVRRFRPPYLIRAR